MKVNLNEIEAHDADRLACSLLKAADKLFQNPDIQEEFKKWQQERQKKGA